MADAAAIWGCLGDYILFKYPIAIYMNARAPSRPLCSPFIELLRIHSESFFFTLLQVSTKYALLASCFPTLLFDWIKKTISRPSLT